MKTSDLLGPALDWAVAKCEGAIELQRRKELVGEPWFYYFIDEEAGVKRHTYLNEFQPSKDWSEGGPILDQIEGLYIKKWLESRPDSKCEAHIHNYEGNWIEFGPSPLIAAMRVYVASKLGPEVDIPEELR